MMATARMHADEIIVSDAQARSLIDAQFPQHAGLLLTKVNSGGTDHTIYRLGRAMAVRFPRIPAAAGQAEKDFRWLRPLAPQLALRIPRPLAVGMPTSDYPFHWSVCEWLEGENAFLHPPQDLDHAALKLAEFVRSLRDAPIPSDSPTGGRGGPLAGRDKETRAAITDLHGLIDVETTLVAWGQSLAAPRWDAAPVWLHGDIHPANLIVENGELTGIIDFGCLTVGDPATDLMIAWSMLDASTRQTFRAALSVDDSTWLRGRGWVLSVALIALPYYLETNPVLVSISRRVIEQVLEDFKSA
jgi:aminoglycoside phosphotransferase (APT) family kinase protein